jgi:hypothetical protein
MYRCEICNQTTEPKEPCIKMIVKTRVKQYPVRNKVCPAYFWANGVFKRSDKFQDRRDDPGGMGAEIAAEKKVCKKCACNHTANLQ